MTPGMMTTQEPQQATEQATQQSTRQATQQSVVRSDGRRARAQGGTR
jgi:hypothetical protein